VTIPRPRPTDPHGRTLENLLRAAPAVALVCTAGCSALSRSPDDPAPIVRGPIPARTQAPIALTYLAFRPRRAVIQPEGKVGVGVLSAYSSIFQNGSSAQDSVVLDGEVWSNSLLLRWGAAEDCDLELELPVVYATSGFLDLFVENWHDFFGLPDGGRDSRPRFAYEMEATHGGQTAYSLEGNEPGLGDVPILYTRAIRDEDAQGPALAWRAGIELPTGSESRGFGNGKIDAGAGLLAERSWGRWTTTAGVDFVKRASSDSFERAGVEAQDDFSGQLGAEYRWNDGLSLVCGLAYDSPVTEDIALKEIDHGILSLDLGAAFDLAPGSRLILGFGEDLIAASGPDFTVSAALTFGL
jgi:hypothetical protein